MASVEVRDLSELLSLPISADAQLESARRLANIGTPDALGRLVREVIQEGPAADACITALAECGSGATECVLRALQDNPDSAALALCLPQETSEEAAKVLLRVCRRTTSAHVMRYAVEGILRSAPALTSKLEAAVKLRPEGEMRTAARIGWIAVHPEARLEHLPQYLSPEASAAAQSLALTVPGVEALPEFAAWVSRRLSGRTVRERCQGLRYCVIAGRGDFAERVSHLYLRDPSPNVRYRAFEAMGQMPQECAPFVRERLRECCQKLSEVVQRLARCAATDWTQDHVTVVTEAVEALKRGVEAAQLVGASVELDAEVNVAITEAEARLVLACSRDDVSTGLLQATETLLTLRVGAVRRLWQTGVTAVRYYAINLCGMRAATATGLELAPYPPPNDCDLAEGLRHLRSLAGVQASLLAGLVRDDDEASHLADYPLTRRALVRMQVQEQLARLSSLGGTALPALLNALEQSLDSETRARSRATRMLGEGAVEEAQRACVDSPFILIDLETSLLSAAMAASSVPAESSAAGTQALWTAMAEQQFQAGLLGALTSVSPVECTETLLRCLRSRSELVAESAEQALCRLGTALVPDLVELAHKTRDDRQRARALEVGRWLEPRAFVDLARQHLGSHHELVAAVSARILGQAGSTGDAEALRGRLNTTDELVAVCILEALASLDWEAHEDLFLEAASSLWCGTRWAGQAALLRCPADQRQGLFRRLRASTATYHRRFAEHFGSCARGTPRARFCGTSFTTAGSAWLGSRLARRESSPWQWGIPTLSRDPVPDGAAHRQLIASHPDLEADWDAYGLHGKPPLRLLRQLRDLACTDDLQAAAPALDLFVACTAWECRVRAETHLQYHGLRIPEDLGRRMRTAVLRALKQCTPDQLMDIARAVPMGRAGGRLLAAYLRNASFGPDKEHAFLVTFGFLLSRQLPEVLGTTQLVVPGPHQPAERAAAIEAEWRRLWGYRDLVFGFMVCPRLSTDLLVWYCQNGTDDETSRAMVNYLAMAVTALPQLPEDRQASIEALKEIYRRRLSRAVSDLRQASKMTEDEARSTVMGEFEMTLRQYDPFWATDRPVWGPLGTLDLTVRHPDARGLRPLERGVARNYLPLTHCLDRRLHQLVSGARREQKRLAQTQTTDWSEGSDAWQASPDGWGADDGPRTPGDLRLITPKVVVQTPEGPVECVHLDAAAEELGTTVSALRKRCQRGTVSCLKHEGVRVIPADALEDIRASQTKGRELAELLSVHRNTIRRWRQEAPMGLTPRQQLQYLAERAQAAGKVSVPDD